MSDLDRVHQVLRDRMPEVITNLRAKVNEHAPDAPPREGNSRVQNAHGQDGDTAVLRIYDEIWTFGITADQIARDLEGITAPKIRVEINSPGGDVWDGVAIFNALRAHPAEVTTRVDGIAASIASVILQGGDRRLMMSGSQAMVHNAWGMTVGDTRDHADMVDILAHQDGIIASIYAARSGKPEAEFRELMNAESWMTADEAVDAGLADEVVEPPSKTKDKAPTLVQKIDSAVSAVDEAIGSAEQVSAIRAEAGKTLSVVNVESLSGLRASLGRLDGLLNGATPDEQDQFAEDRQALARRLNDFQAALPPQLIG